MIERETGLEEIAESGVMLHADLSADLLVTIFMPRTALHDGAVIVRGEQIVAAGALLPLAELTVQAERLGTRHRAALGIAADTDAVVVVVSEESGQVSLVERSRIRRNLNEPQLTRAIVQLLRPSQAGRSLVQRGTGAVRSVAVARPGTGRVSSLRRTVRGSTGPETAPAPPPADRPGEDGTGGGPPTAGDDVGSPPGARAPTEVHEPEARPARATPAGR